MPFFKLLVSLTLLFSGPANIQLQDDPISEVGTSNWSKPVYVASNTVWAPVAQSAGFKLENQLAADLKGFVAGLKQAGAIRVVATYSSPADPSLKVYGIRYQSVRYHGESAAGVPLAGELSLTSVPVDYANNLVRLNSSTCSLEPFRLANPATWIPLCNVIQPSVNEFLRGQVAVQLSLGCGQLPDEVRYEVSKLRYVLQHKLPYTISGNYLIFHPVASFGTDNKVWLGTDTGWFDFKITINKASWLAKVQEIAPNPQKLSKRVSLDLENRSLIFG